jgi:hypothetical protein
MTWRAESVRPYLNVVGVTQRGTESGGQGWADVHAVAVQVTFDRSDESESCIIFSSVDNIGAFNTVSILSTCVSLPLDHALLALYNLVRWVASSSRKFGL